MIAHALTITRPSSGTTGCVTEASCTCGGWSEVAIGRDEASQRALAADWADHWMQAAETRDHDEMGRAA